MLGLARDGHEVLVLERETAFRDRVRGEWLRFTPDDWMIPLFGESMANDKRNVLEGRFIATALSSLRLGFNVILDFGVWAKDERTALRWLASTAGAECELVYVAIGAAEQRDRVNQRPESTFPITQSDLDEWRTIFEPPLEEELSGNSLDPPPSGFDSWRAWVVEWWPTSLS